MNILIFGASGQTGQHLVSQALEQGHQVAAFVRNPDKIKIRDARLTIHVGNVINYSEVLKAVADQQAVLSALGADNMFKFDRALVDGMQNILRAMQSTELSRLIYLSTWGVKESRGDAGFLIRQLAPTLLKTEIMGHEEREKMIRSSGIDWSIIHAPILTNGPLTRKYLTGEDIVSKQFATKLSRADVADFMLSQLADFRFVKKSVRVMPVN